MMKLFRRSTSEGIGTTGTYKKIAESEKVQEAKSQSELRNNAKLNRNKLSSDLTQTPNSRETPPPALPFNPPTMPIPPPPEDRYHSLVKLNRTSTASTTSTASSGRNSQDQSSSEKLSRSSQGSHKTSIRPSEEEMRLSRERFNKESKKPGRPVKLDAPSWGDEFAQITWEPPPPEVPGGELPSIDKYLIEKRDIEMRVWVMAAEVNGDETCCVVRNLREDSTYEFRISAINRHGQGQASAVFPLQRLLVCVSIPWKNPYFSSELESERLKPYNRRGRRLSAAMRKVGRQLSSQFSR
ncbi:hypothetical protein CHUAL_004704 [Chamberlinius hualienensis]